MVDIFLLTQSLVQIKFFKMAPCMNCFIFRSVDNFYVKSSTLRERFILFGLLAP